MLTTKQLKSLENSNAPVEVIINRVHGGGMNITNRDGSKMQVKKGDRVTLDNAKAKTFMLAGNDPYARPVTADDPEEVKTKSRRKRGD